MMDVPVPNNDEFSEIFNTFEMRNDDPAEPRTLSPQEFMGMEGDMEETDEFLFLFYYGEDVKGGDEVRRRRRSQSSVEIRKSEDRRQGKPPLDRRRGRPPGGGGEGSPFRISNETPLSEPLKRKNILANRFFGPKTSGEKKEAGDGSTTRKRSQSNERGPKEVDDKKTTSGGNKFLGVMSPTVMRQVPPKPAQFIHGAKPSLKGTEPRPTLTRQNSERRSFNRKEGATKLVRTSSLTRKPFSRQNSLEKSAPAVETRRSKIPLSRQNSKEQTDMLTRAESPRTAKQGTKNFSSSAPPGKQTTDRLSRQESINKSSKVSKDLKKSDIRVLNRQASLKVSDVEKSKSLTKLKQKDAQMGSLKNGLEGKQNQKDNLLPETPQKNRDKQSKMEKEVPTKLVKNLDENISISKEKEGPAKLVKNLEENKSSSKEKEVLAKLVITKVEANKICSKEKEGPAKLVKNLGENKSSSKEKEVLAKLVITKVEANKICSKEKEVPTKLVITKVEENKMCSKEKLAITKVKDNKISPKEKEVPAKLIITKVEENKVHSKENEKALKPGMTKTSTVNGSIQGQEINQDCDPGSSERGNKNQSDMKNEDKPNKTKLLDPIKVIPWQNKWRKAESHGATLKSNILGNKESLLNESASSQTVQEKKKIFEEYQLNLNQNKNKNPLKINITKANLIIVDKSEKGSIGKNIVSGAPALSPRENKQLIILEEKNKERLAKKVEFLMNKSPSKQNPELQKSNWTNRTKSNSSNSTQSSIRNILQEKNTPTPLDINGCLTSLQGDKDQDSKKNKSEETCKIVKTKDDLRKLDHRLVQGSWLEERRSRAEHLKEITKIKSEDQKLEQIKKNSDDEKIKQEKNINCEQDINLTTSKEVTSSEIEPLTGNMEDLIGSNFSIAETIPGARTVVAAVIAAFTMYYLSCK